MVKGHYILERELKGSWYGVGMELVRSMCGEEAWFLRIGIPGKWLDDMPSAVQSAIGMLDTPSTLRSSL